MLEKRFRRVREGLVLQTAKQRKVLAIVQGGTEAGLERGHLSTRPILSPYKLAGKASCTYF